MNEAGVEIVLIEDNPGDARLLREYLREAELPLSGFRHFATLEEGIAGLQSGPAEVVLLDLSLPDAHGLETVERMLQAADGTAIIVLTGLDDQELAVRAVHAGAQDYLVKGSVDPTTLSRSIRYAVERKELAMEREARLRAEREARAVAEQAVRARDQVLRVVSHDLGNHLMAIRLNALVLDRLAGRPDAEESRLRAAEIILQVEAMSRLRQDLLVAAAIESGRLTINPRDCDIEDCIQDATAVARPLALDREQTLEVRCPPDLQEIRADPDRVKQALANLLGNAIKFSPRGSRIVVSAELTDSEAIVGVIDEGPGVPEDVADRVFESFWKGGEGSGGAGLGLSIVRGIAEAHGGRAWYEPGQPRGSAFFLAFPLQPSRT